MSQTFTYRRRVEFRDTDMAGIVHFSVFHAYMEEAEHAFLRSLGLGVISEFEGQQISFPRVNANCNYRRAIKFEQEIDIKVSIERVGAKSITYSHSFCHEGEIVAEGSITAVCCFIEHGSAPRSCEIPNEFREKLHPFIKIESQ
ncbi:acyl-CoA thioesterase [bacterium]|nr:acyl-CoA thioesterase [bacterium]